MAQEAYVRIQEVLKDAPALATTATPFLVAGPVVAECGDSEITYFTSREAFLNKYTLDGKLSPNAHISLINAYELLGSVPILVGRLNDAKVDMEEKPEDANSCGFIDVFTYPTPRFPAMWSYKLSNNPRIPGAIDLSIKYAKYIGDLRECKLRDIVEKGSGYLVNDVLVSEYQNINIYAKVTSVDKDGGILTVKILPVSIDRSLGELEFTGGTGSGFKCNLVTTRSNPDLLRSYEVTFSLNNNITDEQGNSLYYKNVWKDEWPFKVNETKLPVGIEVTKPNPLALTDPSQPETISYLDYLPREVTSGGSFTQIPAWTEFNWAKTERKFQTYVDRKIPIFTDFGESGAHTILKGLANLHGSLYTISLPRNMESVAGGKSWEGVDLGNSRCYVCTPFALTTHLGFNAAIAPTTQYIKTVVNNMQAGREFEAVAGKVTGVVQYNTLTKRYDKAEREQLLDRKINTITFREVDGFAMFNDDLTCLVQNNPFKEEFNRRLGVRIAQDTETLMEQFKFQLNTAALRDKVEAVLSNYLDTASFRDKLWAYEVKCNDENNPPSLQAQNKLAVTVNIAFYYTAKYIEVVNNIYSVGQSFNE